MNSARLKFSSPKIMLFCLGHQRKVILVYIRALFWQVTRRWRLFTFVPKDIGQRLKAWWLHECIQRVLWICQRGISKSWSLLIRQKLGTICWGSSKFITRAFLAFGRGRVLWESLICENIFRIGGLIKSRKDFWIHSSKSHFENWRYH